MEESEAEEEQWQELVALQAIFSEEEYLKLNSTKRGHFFTSLSESVELADPSSAAGAPAADGAVQENNLLTSGDFSAHVHLSDSFKIQDFQGDKETTNIRFLPPIVLGFELPSTYPAEDPPTFNLSCKWLTISQMSQLCGHLDELWADNKGTAILYIWFDFLQQEALKYLGLDSCLEIKNSGVAWKAGDRVIQDIASPKLLYDLLVDYNKQQHKLEFEKSTWPCAVCFCDKSGSDSFKFYDCSHIYCRECMTQHFTVRIESGDVTQLTCPEEGCNTQGHPSQLKDLLSAELYERYERLLLQTTLDKMLDIVYCPRTFCQAAVILDPDSSMGSCAACSFVFCKKCRMSYHGIHPCNIGAAQLKGKLDEASAAEQEAYKEKYGKQFVEALLRECASYQWMEKNCERCPVCPAQITKIDGCNKMTCAKCKVSFCWICKAVLPGGDPYVHFRNNKECHLFPGEEEIDIVFDDIDLMGMG